MTQREKQRRLAPALLAETLEQTEPFELAAIVAKSSVPDTFANHCGTVVGRGQNGRDGMRIWKVGKKISPCQENARIAVEYMTDSDIEAFLEERDWDADEFVVRITALPTVAVEVG